jgi:hypothetical protein
MKTGLFLSALVAFGGLAASPGHAQYHPPSTSAATKPMHANAAASPGVRHGSIGGPANKFGGINGTGKPPRH